MLNKRQIGSSKESLAAKYLEEKGYKILEMNYQVRQAEIDIIAIKDDTICFIEVKYRRDNYAGDPFSAVTASKQRKICKASLHYMNQHRINPYTANIRYDVVGITGDNIELLENAFPYIGY